MITISPQRISPQKVLLDSNEFEELIKRVIIFEPVVIKEIQDDISIKGIMKLIETDNAFEFLNNPQENIYTVNDLKERYR